MKELVTTPEAGSLRSVVSATVGAGDHVVAIFYRRAQTHELLATLVLDEADAERLVVDLERAIDNARRPLEE